tara:strand:+ start:278 stop:610 length:333 start_codon:yes stop_codon:yes gene_type:complete
MGHIAKKPKYQLIPHEKDRFAIKILEKKFYGIVFLIGKVGFEPIEGHDQMRFKYEFEILQNPNNKKETKVLKTLVGDIIMEFLNTKYSEDQTDEHVELDGGETNTLSTVE